MSSDTSRDLPIGPDNTPFEVIGGEPRVRLLAETFYQFMDEDPEFQGFDQCIPRTCRRLLRSSFNS